MVRGVVLEVDHRCFTPAYFIVQKIAQSVQRAMDPDANVATVVTTLEVVSQLEQSDRQHDGANRNDNTDYDQSLIRIVC